MEEKKLSPKQALFVSEYLKDGNGTRAAIAAGYVPGNAKQSAWRLLHRHPAVTEAVDRARTAVAVKTEYNLEQAHVNLTRQIERAVELKQMSAVAKLEELRMKLHGLLVEKHDVRHAGFVINILGVGDDE